MIAGVTPVRAARGIERPPSVELVSVRLTRMMHQNAG